MPRITVKVQRRTTVGRSDTLAYTDERRLSHLGIADNDHSVIVNATMQFGS